MDKAVEELIDEVRLLWNALVKRGEEIHAGEAISMGQRAVLEFLARNGPVTVPNLARQRRVSRQHVQALVNPLLEGGLVEAAPNPAHKRSPLLRLTPAGERRIRRMKRRETALFREAGLDLSEAQLRRAASALRSVRRAVDD